MMMAMTTTIAPGRAETPTMTIAKTTMTMTTATTTMTTTERGAGCG